MPQVDEIHDLAQVLAGTARDLAAAPGPQATLEQACEQAVAVIAGCSWAGVCEKDRDGHSELLAVSDDTVRVLHEMQYEIGDGPCRKAAPEQRIVWSDDLADEKRWPQFATAAVDRGVRSLASIQLYTRKNTVVTLHLYAATPGAFDEVTRDVAQIFGAHAASAIAGARDYAHVSRALVTRQQIGQLTGILAERHKLTTDEAFALLVQTSHEHNIKLRDLAARLVAEEDKARLESRERPSG
ncbi:MAG TPA: GAF and ANTAR domain-containing protein [Streptosporangiales bacterium]